MTALLKFVITSILGLVGFTTTAEHEVVKENYAPHDQEQSGLTISKSSKNCDSILKNSCFLLK